MTPTLRTHNPKVAGSNPAPAIGKAPLRRGFFVGERRWSANLCSNFVPISFGVRGRERPTTSTNQVRTHPVVCGRRHAGHRLARLLPATRADLLRRLHRDPEAAMA